MDDYTHVLAAIEGLPSAQPEQKKNELNLTCEGCYYHGKTTGCCTLCARWYPDLYENRSEEI